MPVAAPNKKAVEFFLKQSCKFWLQTDNRQTQGHLAIALKRFNAFNSFADSTPLDIMKSLKERSVTNEEMPVLAQHGLSWWWYRAPIETQALMIEAFDEVVGDAQAVADATLSEYLWKIGRKLMGRSLVLPRWLDWPLRSLKYLLLAFFVFIVFTMSTETPGRFSRVSVRYCGGRKRSNLPWATSAVSGYPKWPSNLCYFIQNAWCRFLCPYGALMGIVSTLSPGEDSGRDQHSMHSNGRVSAQACPSHLPVDTLVPDSLQWSAPDAWSALLFVQPRMRCSYRFHGLEAGRSRSAAGNSTSLAAPRSQTASCSSGAGGCLLRLIGLARATNHWHTNVSRETYMNLIPDFRPVRSLKLLRHCRQQRVQATLVFDHDLARLRR